MFTNPQDDTSSQLRSNGFLVDIMITTRYRKIVIITDKLYNFNVQLSQILHIMSRKELRKSFTPSYFSVEDILASETRVPCETEVQISKCGFLDPSGGTEDLAVGSVVELPLWAATRLCKQKREKFITVKTPKFFDENAREVLKAEPAVVDLNKMAAHFYQTGLQICTLPNPDVEFIAEVLPETFQKRLPAIFDTYSLNRDFKSTEYNARGEGNAMQVKYMDPLEIQLFQHSKMACKALDNWMRRYSLLFSIVLLNSVYRDFLCPIITDDFYSRC